MKYLLAVAITCAGVVLASPASAEDQRPCVSRAEFRGVNLQGDVTRDELEARWEVRAASASGSEVDYRVCGYGLDEAFVTVAYQEGANPRVPRGNLEVIAAYRFRAYGATLHGRP